MATVIVKNFLGRNLQNFVKAIRRFSGRRKIQILLRSSVDCKLSWVFVLIFCIWGLILRIQHRARLALWTDERWQVDQMHGSFMDLLRSLPKMEYCSYLSGDYYLIYPFFQWFGYNKWGLAIPHLLSTLLGFYVIYKICQRYFKTFWGYLVTFAVVCFNATLIWHSLEIRTYAVLPTLALGVYYFIGELVDLKIHWDRKKQFWVGAFFVLVLLWHAYGVLVMFYPTLYHLGTKLREPLFGKIFKRTMKFLVIVGACASPFWLYSIFGPHITYGWRNTFAYYPNPYLIKNTIAFAKTVAGNLVGFKMLYFLLLGLPIAFILPTRDRFRQIGFFCVLIILPLEIYLMTSINFYYYFLQRQFVWVIPFFAILLGWCWESIVLYLQKKGNDEIQACP